jgi:DNA-binding transcriptional ArsR family regulator
MAQVPAAGDPFEALGDPNRREILRLLSGGDKPVREIADAMTISRPAVSRHLRVLKDAGMVAEQARGTRRIYHLQEQGMRAVQAYLEGIWGEAAVRFRLLAENLAESTDQGPDGDGPAADVLRRRLLSRARVPRVDRPDRHLVAA